MKKEKEDTEKKFFIYLDLEPYLAQWFIHDSGGTQPIVLRKNSVERRILATYLLKLPPGARPNLKENSNVEIV